MNDDGDDNNNTVVIGVVDVVRLVDMMHANDGDDHDADTDTDAVLILWWPVKPIRNQLRGMKKPKSHFLSNSVKIELLLEQVSIGCQK